MFCLGDKWQNWEDRGFANRSANIANVLSKHPAVDALVVVNNPTSYIQMFKKYITKTLSSRTINRHSINWYLMDEVSPKTTVVEQVRLFPRAYAHPITFLLNNLLYDGGLTRIVKEVMAEKSRAPLVLWLNSPVFVKYAGWLGEDLVVYDARDDWVSHPQLRPIRRAIANGYKLTKGKADLVFTVSERLASKFNGGRPEVFHVPNGVNDEVFNKIHNKTPDDLANLPRPIIGYVGKMQQRFDVAFLAKVARLMPGVSFALVGPVFTPEHFKPVRKIPNVHFLGWKHQSTIPSYIKNFDICMMPHVDDDFTSAMNPIKLYEYLAMGKPTICTRVQGLEQFDRFIEIANDPESFVELARLFLLEPEDKKLERMNFARKQDWDTRVDYMIKIVNRKLKERISTVQAEDYGTEMICDTKITKT